MDQNKRTHRGIDPKMEKMWLEALNKENMLRMDWFRKNEPRLQAKLQLEESLKKAVSPETNDEMKKEMVAAYRNVKRHVVPPFQESPPDLKGADHALHNVMRPVDPDVTKLLHSGTDKNGRAKYLKARYKIIPEQRYYFPETSSFTYGWNMWNHAINNRMSTAHGRKQVIKESFYRRRGVNRDPDWYREPAKLSPNVCGRI